nr:uncharacterized protein LOC100178027 isoform X1 [Ciona intestinalis]|eukprot:XP_009858785.2 uncharacterized protein LOC100178027 isoform X1 [Ciona intestinalis]
MPRSWNLRRLLRLDSKSNTGTADEKTSSKSAANKSSSGGKQKRKAPPKPTELPPKPNSKNSPQKYRSVASTSSSSWSSSSATGYSPSSVSTLSLPDSNLSSPASKGLQVSSVSLRSGVQQDDLTRDKTPAQTDSSALSNHTKVLNAEHEDSVIRESQTPQTSSLALDHLTNGSISNVSDQVFAKRTRLETENPNFDTEEPKSGRTSVSNLSGYVESAILSPATTNLLSSSPGKLDPLQVPRLQSFESSSTLDKESVSSPSATDSVSAVRLDYVSLDYVRSAAAERRNRRKEDDESTVRSTSSLSSSFISSIDSEDGSTIGSDVVENLYNKITEATARHSAKNPSFRTVSESGTGDIERDLFPLIFPGRLRENKSEDKLHPKATHVDLIRPPSKPDSLQQLNDNNSNNTLSCDTRKEDTSSNDVSHTSNKELPNNNPGFTKCDKCFGIIEDSNLDSPAMNRAKDFFGQCLCHSEDSADQVTELDYCSTNLKEVPAEIWSYSATLTKLLLESNTITELPKELFTCQNLRYLSVSDNDISVLPASLASLVNLNHLDISKNVIEDVPECIRCCKNLHVLDASVNPVERLSEGFTQLMSLRELYMNDCFFDFLPANFGRMSQLRVLELRDNQLQILPKSMRRLTLLSRLDLGGNVFQEWPDVICELTNLTELWLDCNELNRVPTSIGDLTKLTYLDLSRNFLESIPSQIGNLECLKDLLLSENSLGYLPDTIGFLRQLNILNLEMNQLTTLPESMGKLTMLEELDITHNKLDILPTSIGNLRSLKTLLLDDNNIYEVPAELGSCTQLNILQLSRNNIEQLPDSLGDLVNLCVLNLCQNRLPYLPITMIKLTKLHALWVSSNQSKPNVPLHAELCPDNGRRILTNVLFPQQDKETSRAKTILFDESGEGYANDAADDDDLEAYARRERGNTHVVFNMDAITYSTDVRMLEDEVEEMEEQKDEEQIENKERSRAVDLVIKYGDMQKNEETDNELSTTNESMEVDDPFSVLIPSGHSHTNLSVVPDGKDRFPEFGDTRPMLKTANILRVTTDKSGGPGKSFLESESDPQLSHSDQDSEFSSTPSSVVLREEAGNMRLTTKKITELLTSDAGKLDVQSSQSIRTWTSHSNLPLVTDPPEQFVDSKSTTSSRLPLPSRLLKKGGSTSSSMTTLDSTSTVGGPTQDDRNIHIHSPVKIEPTINTESNTDHSKDVDPSENAFTSARNLLNRLEQLAKRNHAVSQNEPSPAALMQLHADRTQELHATTTAVASELDRAHKAEPEPQSAATDTAVSVPDVQTNLVSFSSIPYMDSEGESDVLKPMENQDTTQTIEEITQHNRDLSINGLTDAGLRRRKDLENLPVSEISKLETNDQSPVENETYTLSPAFAVEGKSSSVTSGETTTDHDSGVGNDVESQESIPDVQDDHLDFGNNLQTSKTTRAESTTVKTIKLAESTAVRRNNRGWLALVRTDNPTNTTAPAEHDFSAKSPRELPEPVSIQPFFPPHTKPLVAPTTVTYSNEYNARQNDDSKNKVSDNIKKFEKFFESGFPVPARPVPPEPAPKNNRQIKSGSLSSLSQPSSITTVHVVPSVPDHNLSPQSSRHDSEFPLSPSKERSPKPREEPLVASPKTRRSSGQRKSKFEEALAATKHKHFRDRLEKMMQDRSPTLSYTKRASQSSVTSLASIPRITSPVPRALSPHGKQTPFEHLTAEDTFAPETNQQEQQGTNRTSRSGSIHARLKEKLVVPTPVSAGRQVDPVPQRPHSSAGSNHSRSQNANTSRPNLGRRGSTQRSSVRSQSITDTEEKAEASETDGKKSLEEQLGQLIIGVSTASPPPRDEHGFVPYRSTGSAQQQLSMTKEQARDLQGNLNFPVATTQGYRKPPMPVDWRHQLLRHIERKRLEKNELCAIHSLPVRGSIENQFPGPAGLKDREMTRNSEVRRSFAREAPRVNQRKPEPQQIISRSTTAPEIGQRTDRKMRRDSSLQENVFVRSVANTQQSKQPGRRSSGRFLRTRTPGPEMAGSMKQNDVAIRPKSAMDIPYNAPGTYAPVLSGHSDWNVAAVSKEQMQLPSHSTFQTVAPPSYEDHLLRRAYPGVAQQQNHDYVNVEYVDQMRASSRRKKKEEGEYLDDLIHDPQAAYPLRSTGSHESVLNAKMDKMYTYDVPPPIPSKIRSSNSHDSILDNPHNPKQMQRYVESSYNTQNYVYLPSRNQPYPEYAQHYPNTYRAPPAPKDRNSQYGVIPAPTKTQRPQRSKKHPTYVVPSRWKEQEDPMYPPPPHGFHDDYAEHVPPLSPSLQRAYSGEKEDESVASAFRPYHQNRQPQQSSKANTNHYYQPPPTHQYDDRLTYNHRPTIIDHHRYHHHLERGNRTQHNRAFTRQQERPHYMDEYNGESDPSLSGEIGRHWHEEPTGVDIVTVTVRKNPTFGFHIMGGIDAGGNPYRPDDDGVFITYVAPGGSADGHVQPGDKLLLVNGSDFVGITHKRAVDLLRNAGHVAVLVVERLVGRPV